MKTIGMRVRVARAARKMTLKGLAAALGAEWPQLTDVTLSRRERDETPYRADEIPAIAAALDVTVGYLHGLESPNFGGGEW